jgi:hypothetical protein
VNKPEGRFPVLMILLNSPTFQGDRSLILLLNSSLLCRMLSGMKNAAPQPESLKERLEKRIARKRGDVFLRSDFSDLGGYDQVGRELRGLVRKGRLIKAGYGIYTRARPSAIDGKPTPTKGLRELAQEALGRIGVETAPTRIEQDYNAGRITQVPTGRVIGVRGRVRRQIFYNGFPLDYERVGPESR